MNEKELILHKLILLKPEISKEYHITSIALFGSFARGEQTPNSDVDVLVDFSDTPDLLRFIELEEKIKAVLGRNVDLVPRRKLRAELFEQIENEKIAV
ncbi:MAG TPA: nucleotidyltransferase family protein [Sulfuricurvum sp.]|nr:MAG: nucleotidyltransferase [Campylobacterales bacterium 16-40-21]OZA03049.1 MAG: nucleotidyltransferase [Sulfuricurvum sp. 17-40-25]HQS66866.1 nucleotidyltransferase family protein [Sulfuricurvum sp.]HQT35604.1 nucleotidyltransferase family protein [Sulfuricurvum sp.]